jgi:hypothetical protein
VQVVRVKPAQAGLLDFRCKPGTRQPQAGHVDTMRAGARVGRQAVSATPEQARGTASVPPPRVRQADSELSQSLPQVALGRRSGLPRRLKHLVGVERAIGVDQLLSGRQGFQRRKGPVVGWRLAGCVSGQRPAERVARPRIPRPPGSIAIPAGVH